MGIGQYNEQLAAAERAATLARAIGDGGLLTTAQERRAAALLMLGRLEETCRALTEEVIPACEATGRLWTLMSALDTLARAYEYMGDYQQERIYLRQGMLLAQRMDDPAAMAGVLYVRGLNAFALGQWQGARADFEHAATLVVSTGQFLHTTYSPYGLGLLCLAEGREEEAIDYLTQALTLAQRNRDMQMLCAVQGLLAEWELLAGRPAAACNRLAPLLDMPGPLVSYSKEPLTLLAWTYLELDEAEQAQALLTQVLRTARQAQMFPSLVQALRVQALLLSKEERSEEAEQALQEALMLCRRMGAPYAEAKVLYTAGLVSYEKKEGAAARQQFEAAREICTRLGEGLYALRIEQALARLSRQDTV
jgi:tetratricopeptide (TPR) repeat protein